ncbi:MAG: hypothetical protein LBC95_00470 [Candidatus Nomurabacteria bacterium]|jgi:hypothetical protein|nr:hypothetical protein [Candidatus Nomurabacteria bacterium]
MKTNRVIIPQGAAPEKFEITAAQILAKHFCCDIEFLPEMSNKTPDFVIDGVRWELKSPIGKGKHNIHHVFARAMRQSKNIIIDARRSKDDVRRIRNKLKNEAKIAKTLKRLIFITKEEKVEVLK